TTDSFDESKMTFGPFPDGSCFRVEESSLYKEKREGVKIAEFVLLRTNNKSQQVMWIVEAKESAPKPADQEISTTSRCCPEPESSAMTSELDAHDRFERFICCEIREKLVKTLSLVWAACLGRHGAAGQGLPEAFMKLDFTRVDVKFVLVINGYPLAWLDPLQSALRSALRPTVKTWSFDPNAVVVLNHELALEQKLITAWKTRAGSDGSS
ncbi:MAG: hypothetical protein HQL97_14180, partial [Magnetococcales bacterium]|nr:hypothetical protein [Magnetococcales bacterium]